ncbi:MAG: hypothetical protein ACP5F8_01090 [Candidatus Aenigmatarchaeota archaeon]
MRSEEEIRKFLEKLKNLKFDGYPYFSEFGIKNIDEYNTAIKVLKWVLKEI